MTYPTEPLIVIDKGQCRGYDISGTVATLVDVNNPEFGYQLLDGPRAGYSIYEDGVGDKIIAWRPCAAIPIGKLSFLRDVFMGIELRWNQYAAVQRLAAYLPEAVADESE